MPATREKPRQTSKIAAAASPMPKLPPKALPVTLLSGFLGSGKTTLLQHILRSEHGLRIAVVVNDIGAINIDASLIKQTHRLTQKEEKIIALQNGCICCTLRGDLLEELVRLAELQTFDYIIIESSGISEPEQVAETFDNRLAEHMEMMGDAPEGLDQDMLRLLKQLKRAGGLERFARLDTTVTVLDTFTLFHDFETPDLLSARRNDVTPEDERTVSDLLVDQIEFADVIILNKIDTVDLATQERIVALVRKLNHRAKIIPATFAQIDVAQIVNTAMFDLQRAQTGSGWLQDLHEMTLREINGRTTLAPRPETEEYNVANFVYTRRRPFHPARLFRLLHDKFILQLEPFDEEEDDDDDDDEDEEMGNSDDDDNDVIMDQADERSTTSISTSDASTALTTPSGPSLSPSPPLDGIKTHPDTFPDTIPDNNAILANKRAHRLFRRLFRSKGEFFLATRPHRAGEWSQAGAMLTLAGGRPWFVTLPEEEYRTGDAEIDGMVKWDLEKGGEWGDRRQELVFIGENLDIAGVERVLDECLLRDEEWEAWQGVMSGEGSVEDKMEKLADLFDDGFPDWFDEAEEENDDDDAHYHGGHTHAHAQHKPKHVIKKGGVISSA